MVRRKEEQNSYSLRHPAEEQLVNGGGGRAGGPSIVFSAGGGCGGLFDKRKGAAFEWRGRRSYLSD